MGKTLIITEKPSVAREYAKILGVKNDCDGYIKNDEYIITWCVGHLIEMDYPEDYDISLKAWKAETLPFLPNEYKYHVKKDTEKQYQVVHKWMKSPDIDCILYAGDSGREGQVIEELIRMHGGVRKGIVEKRVWIDSCTKEEILRGIREAKPMSDYDNLASAGIMRGIEDYAIGINLTRILSIKYGNRVNAMYKTAKYKPVTVGRVMTCVLGMVTEREREIESFKEDFYYTVRGDFDNKGNSFIADWKAIEGSKYFESPLLFKENGFKNREDAEKLIAECKAINNAVISDKKISREKKSAPLLYNLAELQAACSKYFHIMPSETLSVAQSLYEKKLTTYPRTDARVLSTAIAKESSDILYKLKYIRNYEDIIDAIEKNGYFKGIENTKYTDDSKITDHYAIIPTGNLEALHNLTGLENAVYDLIVRRYLSIFYPPAEYERVSVSVKIDTETFFSTERICTNLGYLYVIGDNGKYDTDKFKTLTDVKIGDSIDIKDITIKESMTTPPKRYTTGTLILAMENAGKLIEDEELRAQIKTCGIGTSATRAEIIKKLQTNEHISIESKTQEVRPTDFGKTIYDIVKVCCPSLLKPEMTASWEKGLSSIENGSVSFSEYKEKLDAYVANNVQRIKSIPKEVEVIPGVNVEKELIGAKCPLCNGDIQTISFGYGCTNYRKDGSGCNFVIGEICKKKLNKEDVLSLLNNGETDTIQGFKAKSGKSFDAKLKFVRDSQNQLKIEFVFNNEEKETGYTCPLCRKPLKENDRVIFCSSCDFKLWKEICKRKLSDVDIDALLTKGETSNISGFISKKGKPFTGKLVLNGNKVEFDFT